MSRKKLLYVLLSVVIAVLLMWVLFREIDPEDVKKTLLGLSLPALGAFIAVHLFAVWLRAWRYKLLLRPHPCSWSGIILATLVRNSFDDLLPARIGSLSYIYILNQRLGIAFESAASSFVVAFVLDFLTLGPFLIIAVLAVGAGKLRLSGAALAAPALGFFALTVLILWKLAPITRLAGRACRYAFRGLSLSEKPWAKTVLDKIELVRESLDRARRPGLMSVVLVQSFFIRLAKYVSIYFLLWGFLGSHGYRLTDISFWRTNLGLTGAEFTAIFPVKGLGGFGTWEMAWTVTFQLLGFPVVLAADKLFLIKSTGLGVHLTTNLLEYGLGLAGILLLLLPYLRRRRDEARKMNAPASPD